MRIQYASTNANGRRIFSSTHSLFIRRPKKKAKARNHNTVYYVLSRLRKRDVPRANFTTAWRVTVGHIGKPVNVVIRFYEERSTGNKEAMSQSPENSLRLRLPTRDRSVLSRENIDYSAYRWRMMESSFFASLLTYGTK